jgi:formamidopyrimidine-DNA glycosylase
MPELPEVETIRATLKAHVLGKTIERVEVNYEKIIQRMAVTEFQNRLKNQTIQDVGRYGKYLFFIMNDISLVSHLRMEGKYFMKPETDSRTKHEHVIFVFSDGTTLRYHDTRKFGTMELVEKGAERSCKSLSSLGLEPLDPHFTATYLREKIKKSTKPVKNWLLDQTNVCGLGNIYVNEVLFLSRLHPEQKVSDLTDEDLALLAKSSREVLEKAIMLGGTTIRTYYSDLGVSGLFQNELRVHDRKGQPCLICGTPIEKFQLGGRGTYYCPKCQKRRVTS